MRRRICGLISICLAAACLAGCGGADAPVPGGEQSAGSDSSESGSLPEQAGADRSGAPTGLPAVAISGSQPEEDEFTIKRPLDGTPEAIILQITQMRLQPYRSAGDLDAPASQEDVEEQRTARRQRNLKIIELAEEAIAMTHQNRDKEQIFNIAVHRLMDATYQLAMQGDNDAVDQLYGHAESLYARDPESKAASESAWFVARYSNENAERFADQDIRWVQEFSRQSRAFADKFPQDRQRAVGLLHDSSMTCDYWGLRQEAIQCYTALQQKFPETPQAARATGPLRRLGLPGKLLDLGGPTLDGGFLQVTDFKGSPVLIIFWSSQAKPFVTQVSAILATVSKHEKNGLQVIGVNLDLEEPDLDAFLEQTGIGWRTVFHQDKSRRSWDHPVASYYGVQSIPQFWLVDTAGKVVTTTVQSGNLDAALTDLLQ